MLCAVVCHHNNAAADAGDAVACDANCESGCIIQGADRCDSVCATGYVLNTTNYVCMGLSHSQFLW